jgi:5-methylcytosine-specific restriction endonuclease McrA
MSRCTSTRGLEVHHKRVDGGNGLDNAQVLCQKCHEKTYSYGTHGHNPPDFTETTRQAALKQAGQRCECEKANCHS